MEIKMNISAVLRLAAVICFALSIFVNPIPLVPLGLALWCASSII